MTVIISGMIMVAAFGAAAVLGSWLVVALFRASSAGPARPGSDEPS